MVNGHRGGPCLGVKRSLAGVGVAVIDGEIAALDVDPQPMASWQCGGAVADVDREAIDFAGFDGSSTQGGFARRGAEDACGEWMAKAVGVNVEDHRHEIKIRGVGGGVDYRLEVAGERKWFGQRLRCIGEDVWAGGCGLLVVWTKSIEVGGAMEGCRGNWRAGIRNEMSRLRVGAWWHFE